ncbi:hypothetical protein MAPG_08953, partial [Magnaporthiopsis poae ATCC 64411]
MPPEGVYKEQRMYQYRSERSPSPLDESRYDRTVHRYKVTPSRTERVIERVEEYDDYDDRRFRSAEYSGRSDALDIDRRDRYMPERPRSAYEPRNTSTVEHKHVTKRDYDGDGVADDIEVVRETRKYDHDRGDQTSRQVVERIEREPGDPYGPEVRSRVERKVVEHTGDLYDRGPLSPHDRDPDRDWDRHSRTGWERDYDRDAEVRVEKRV